MPIVSWGVSDVQRRLRDAGVHTPDTYSESPRFPVDAARTDLPGVRLGDGRTGVSASR